MVRLYSDPTRLSKAASSGRLADLDQLPPNGVNDGLEPVMRAQLLIDVVEVIPQRLGADVQIVHDVRGALAFGEASQYPVFLVGQRHHRCRPQPVVRHLDELSRRSTHPLVASASARTSRSHWARGPSCLEKPWWARPSSCSCGTWPAMK